MSPLPCFQSILGKLSLQCWRLRFAGNKTATLLGLILGAVLVLPALVLAQTEKTYIYDELGRLKAVVDPASDTAVYNYDAVGNLLTISRQSSSLVSIIEFAPKSGPVGTAVSIFGTGFSTTPTQNTVTFNGAAAVVTSATATEISTTVPSGAITGPISVTVGASTATSDAVFTVTGSTGAPTITSFTPTIGIPGTGVTITGTNFDTAPANNKAIFNIGRSIVNSATATSIATNVPSGTGSGRISVTTPSGKATSSADFFIPPSPYTAADVEFTGRMANPGSTTVTISTANKIALVVFDGTAGERQTLQMSAVTITSSTVSVLKPDGTTLASTSVGTSGGALNVELPTTGTYAIMVDPASTYTGSMTLTVGTVDLVPTALTPPASSGAGQSISVSFTVANQGTGATPSIAWLDRLWFSADTVCCDGADTLLGGWNWTTPVASGGSYTQTKTVTLPNVPAGNYYVFVLTDYSNGIYEQSETNNQMSVPITVNP